jgi:hypothetical protein
MNDDLGRMVLIRCNVRSFSWCYGKMFYVYSNDTSDYFEMKKRRKTVVDGEFKQHVQMLVQLEQ